MTCSVPGSTRFHRAMAPAWLLRQVSTVASLTDLGQYAYFSRHGSSLRSSWMDCRKRRRPILLIPGAPEHLQPVPLDRRPAGMRPASLGMEAMLGSGPAAPWFYGFFLAPHEQPGVRIA